MKCKICKKRMCPITTSLEAFLNGGKRTNVVNVPAEQCPDCGTIRILDAVREKAMFFARINSAISIDYSQCEAKEAAEIIATQMLL